MENLPPAFVDLTLISRPSRRTRFRRPTNIDVPLFPPRPALTLSPEIFIALPSRLVSTILPSVFTEASTPVWSLTLLIAFTRAPLPSFAFTSKSPILTPLIVKLLIRPPLIALLDTHVVSNVALTPVLSDTLLIFSASAPIPLPRPVEIVAAATFTLFTPSTFRKVRLTLPAKVSSLELSNLVRPILSDVVAPIEALTVWFE